MGNCYQRKLKLSISVVILWWYFAYHDNMKKKFFFYSCCTSITIWWTVYPVIYSCHDTTQTGKSKVNIMIKRFKHVGTFKLQHWIQSSDIKPCFMLGHWSNLMLVDFHKYLQHYLKNNRSMSLCSSSCI